MDEKEWSVNILHREGVDRPPSISPMQTGILGLMQAGGSFWPETHHDPKKIADLAPVADRIIGLESARVPFEMAIDASAFGVKISDLGLRRQPMVPERRLSIREEIFELAVPDPNKDGIVPIVLETVRELQKRAHNLPIICGIMAPYMLAFELLGERRR
jgi:uroporphyrinogen-III decarboxylase